MADSIRELLIRLTSTADTAGVDQMEKKFHEAERAADEFAAAVKAGVGIDIGSRIVSSIAAVPAAFRAAIEEGVRFNTTLESAQLSIASLIRQFEPTKFGSVEAALGKSKDTVEKLKAAAAESPASFSSLLEGLRSLSGAAFAANIPLEKQIPLTVTLANAVKALGIADNQVAQEAKALLTGDIDMNAQLARTLGITKEEIERNKERGKLYEFLTQRLSSFAEAGKLAGQTFEGLRSNLGDTLDAIRADASEPIFDALKDGMKTLREELEKPGVKDALKSVGFEVAEIVKGGSALLNFAVRNADTFLALGKAATFAGVAFASLKLKDLIEALGLKALRLAGLVPPLAAATEGTIALAAAEDKEAASALRAAEAEGKLTGARTAAGAASKAGASAPTPASGGGGFRTGLDGGNRVGGAISLGLVLGELGALLIERETAALNKEADAAQKAGEAFTEFGQKRASAIRDGKTYDDSRSKGLAATVQELVEAQIQTDALEKKAGEVVKLYGEGGEILGTKVVVNLSKLTTEERTQYDLLQQKLKFRQKDLDLVDQITTKERGAGPGQQASLTSAQISALDDAFAKARENQIKSLSPASQAREYGTVLADALRSFREKALAAGADAIAVAKVKDVDTLLKFAGDNAGLKGGEIAIKSYDKIYEIQTKIKEATEAAGKAQAAGAENLVKIAADQKAAVAEGVDLTRQKYEIEKQIADLRTQKGLVQSGSDDKSIAGATAQRADYEKQIYALQDKGREIGNAINANEGRKLADAQALTGETAKQTDELKKQRELHKEIAQQIEAQIKAAKQQDPNTDTSDLQKQADRERLRSRGFTDAQIEQKLNPQATAQPTVTVTPGDPNARYTLAELSALAIQGNAGEPSTVTYSGPKKSSAPAPPVNPDTSGYVAPYEPQVFDQSEKLIPQPKFPAEPISPLAGGIGEGLLKDLLSGRGAPSLANDFPYDGPGRIPVPPANFPTLAKPQDDAAEATKRTADELERSGGAIKDAAEAQQKAAQDNLPPIAEATNAAAEAAGTNFPLIAEAATKISTDVTEGTAKVTEALKEINFSEKFQGIQDAVAQMNSDLSDAISSLKGQIASVGASAARTAAPSGAEWQSWTDAG